MLFVFICGLQENELVLVKERDEERERREREVDELKQELLETQEAVSDMFISLSSIPFFVFVCNCTAITDTRPY